MISDILSQYLMALGIVALVLLIVILWRFYFVLSDFKETSHIMKKRAVQFDESLDSLEKSIRSATDMIKGFIAATETGKKIEHKFKDFWDKDKEKQQTKK